MNEARARAALLARPEAYEDFPFGPAIRVFKVRERMFATLGRVPGFEVVGMNLKCDPQQALILREQFVAVIPGYHMNKTHWNTVLLDGSIPEREILWMIDHSYALVVKAMPRAARSSLEVAHGREALYRGTPGAQKITS
jgi:predicted DNA-binding protein (MmcQ/YjbR family)